MRISSSTTGIPGARLTQYTNFVYWDYFAFCPQVRNKVRIFQVPGGKARPPSKQWQGNQPHYCMMNPHGSSIVTEIRLRFHDCSPAEIEAFAPYTTLGILVGNRKEFETNFLDLLIDPRRFNTPHVGIHVGARQELRVYIDPSQAPVYNKRNRPITGFVYVSGVTETQVM